MDDYLDGDSFSSKSNIQTLYSASERCAHTRTLTHTRTHTQFVKLLLAHTIYNADRLFLFCSMTPELCRTVMEKDLCSYCRKPFNTEAKMVLDDMKINCHASCFKVENNTRRHLHTKNLLRPAF